MSEFVDRIESLEAARKVLAANEILRIIEENEIDAQIVGDLPKILDEYRRDEESHDRTEVIKEIELFIAKRFTASASETKRMASLIRLLSTFL